MEGGASERGLISWRGFRELLMEGRAFKNRSGLRAGLLKLVLMSSG